MAGNGHTGAIDDVGARVGILSQRMSTMETVQAEFRKDFVASITAIQGSITALSAKVDDRNKPQWQLLVSLAALMVVILGALGGMSLSPISGAQSRLEENLKTLTAAQTSLMDTLRTNYASREELDWRSSRSKEDRDRTELSLRTLQENVFPREVHLQRWARFDGDISAVRHDMDIQVANLQRQIEQLQKNQGDTYTARDAIMENKDQIRRLEEQIRSLLERKYP